MRFLRLAFAAALIAALAGCTSQPTPNAQACQGWEKANNAWVAAEGSDATSAASIAAHRASLRDDLASAASTASGAIATAMKRTLQAMPENALHIIEPGSSARPESTANSTRVAEACAKGGDQVELQAPPATP